MYEIIKNADKYDLNKVFANSREFVNIIDGFVGVDDSVDPSSEQGRTGSSVLTNIRINYPNPKSNWLYQSPRSGKHNSGRKSSRKPRRISICSNRI